MVGALYISSECLTILSCLPGIVYHKMSKGRIVPKFSHYKACKYFALYVESTVLYNYYCNKA